MSFENLFKAQSYFYWSFGLFLNPSNQPDHVEETSTLFILKSRLNKESDRELISLIY
jgi:hypothetical protein